MKQVGFIPNLDKDNGLVCTKELITLCQQLGAKPLVSRHIAKHLDNADDFISDNIYEESDFLVTLGGDGTMLSTAHHAAPHKTPILGINLGHLGYMTDADAEHGAKSLERAILGPVFLEQRMMIESMISVNDKIINRSKGLALNDIVIFRGCNTKMIVLDLWVDDKYFSRYRADGVIICTATGSTAYSMSAGGPVLTPDARLMCITPICPHSLHARPIIVTSKNVVKVSAINEEAVISADGDNVGLLYPEETLYIKASPLSTTIIRTSEINFYERFQTKMGRPEHLDREVP